MWLYTLIGLTVAVLQFAFYFYLFRVLQRFMKNAVQAQSELQPAGDAMRFALASTLLGGRAFRRQVIEIEENPYRARAPEIGVSPQPIIDSAKKFSERTATYDWGFAALALLIGSIMLARGGPAGFSAFILIVSLIAAPVLVLRKSWQERFKLVRPFLRENYRAENYPSPAPEVGVGAEGEGKVLCYGANVPFTGLGARIGGWSVSIDVNRPTEKGEPAQDVGMDDIYGVVDDAVRRLKIDALQYDTFVFVAGTEATLVEGVSPLAGGETTAPRRTMPREATTEALQREGVHARGYKAYHLVGWGGEVAFTYLLRLVRVGNSISMETIQLVLPSVAPQYREVDRIPRDGLIPRVIWFVETLGSTPVVLLMSLFGVASQIQQFAVSLFGSRKTRELARIRRFPDYNFGYTTSIRQLIAAPQFNSHFQALDATRYRQVLDQQVLNAAADFLEEKGIDISSLREQTRMIQNNTITVSAGGDIDLKGVAIGRGAKAIFSSMRRLPNSAKARS